MEPLITTSLSTIVEPLTVTQLTERIRLLLEDRFFYVKVRGEVLNLKAPSSGHLYFTLSDSGAQIRAVIWRATARRIAVPLVEGEAILATGHLTLYAPRGEYQLVVEGVRKEGAGSEREQLMRLHARLAAEGLFAPERKRPLPFFPSAVGVVTSASGAAIHDILKVLERRFPGFQLVLCPARVQGVGASEEIAAAIDRLNSDGRSQVIICGRGGGDAEDLAAFNSEQVVRAIARSAIPVVSAVGHEIDITLADLVADARASTPSAAAEMVMPEKETLLATVAALGQRAHWAMQRMLERCREQVSQNAGLLRHPRRRIEEARLLCDDRSERLRRALKRLSGQRRGQVLLLEQRLLAWPKGRYRPLLAVQLTEGRRRLQTAMGRLLEQNQEHRQRMHEQLLALSPFAILERGYAIVYGGNGQPARDAAQFKTGDTVEIRLAKGRLQANVAARVLEKP